MGQILGFPTEMAGHPYNSAALLRNLWCLVGGVHLIDKII